MTLIDAVQRWYCPNCKRTDITRNVPPNAARMHTCPGLKGLTAPLIREGQRVRVYAREREDYVGNELAQTNEEGRPMMSVVTERPDGTNDVAVLAPTATARAKGST